MRVKNNKQTSDVWAGQTIESEAEYDIGANELANWRSSDKVMTDLASGDLLIGDGVTYKAAGASAISYLLGTSQEVTIASSPTFTAKTVGALKLYTRATGKVHPVVVGANNLLFSIPFANMKFNGLEIINAKAGETVNLKVLDTITGTVTTVPNYVLNQFGFDLNLPEGFFRWLSSYDADLFQGLQILLEYTAIEERDLRVNYVIHELKA